MTQSAVLHTQTQIVKISTELLIAAVGGTFLALMSQVAFHIPSTFIPITLQSLALLLLAGFLGPRRAVTSVLAYLAQGSIGLPVFAGGLSNPLWYLDSKAGFYFSFIVVAFLVGKLLEKRVNPHFLTFLSVLSLGSFTILAIGAAWLSLFVGIEKAILFGVVPFLSGSIFKAVIASFLLKARALISK